MNNYYVYVYLDPRKPGQYTYPELNISFLYEPIYVGKGSYDRYKSHLWKCRNQILAHKLKHINQLNLSPYFVFPSKKLTGQKAYEIEEIFIKHIGKISDDSGTLCNFADGGLGGNGLKGQANPCSKTNMSEDKRKDKGMKSYQTRLANGQVKTGKQHNFSRAKLGEEKLKAKAVKGAVTRKLLGITEEQVSNMQEAKKAKAPKYILISSKGIEYFIHMDLYPFCKEHNLSYNMLKSRCRMNKFGTIKQDKSHKTETQLNTIGWTIKPN